MAEEISKIVVGGKGFEGVIAKFNINCVSDIKITPKTPNTEVDWISFYVDTNTIHMVVDAWDGEDSRSTSFTISFTAETNSNGGTTACTKDFEVEQLSKKFNPDTGSTDCDYFIVDAGSYTEISAEGGNGCDSAWIAAEGKPIYNIGGVTSDTCDWIEVKKYKWGIDDPSTMCTLYSAYPSVAQRLMVLAKIDEAASPISTDGCRTSGGKEWSKSNTELCIQPLQEQDPYFADKGVIKPCEHPSYPGSPWEYHPPLTAYPQAVQDAVNNNGEYKNKLGTIEYIVKANPYPQPRECVVQWYVNNTHCLSKDFRIKQLGNGGGGGGCTVTLTFTNMDGKTIKIYWDISSTTFEEKTGNGPFTHEYASGTEHYFKVTSEGYKQYDGKFTCGSKETITDAMEEDGGSCNTCEDLGVTDVNPKTDIPATGFTTNAIGYFSASCEYNTANFTVNATGDLQPTGMFVVKTSSNPIVYAVIGTVGATTSERTGTVTVLLKDETSPCVTLNIKQVVPSCDCIQSISGRHVNAAGGLSIVGQFTSDCKLSGYASLEHKLGPQVLDLTQPVTFDDDGNEKVISATVVPNETTSEKTGTYAVKIGNTICEDKLMAITVDSQECKFPGKTIQIFLKMTTHNYENYIITNNVIGSVCHDWVLNDGHKYDGYSVEDAGASLAYYDYRECDVDNYEIGGKYCKIASPGLSSCNGSNETLVPGETYKLYGLNSLGYEYLLDIKMPTDEEAQAAAQDVGGGRIIMYLPNV